MILTFLKNNATPKTTDVRCKSSVTVEVHGLGRFTAWATPPKSHPQQH
jgi:hypothetical protein